MDRFIETIEKSDEKTETDLKSNMDRFIVQNFQKRKETKINLKSNMDRFIVLLADIINLYVLI